MTVDMAVDELQPAASFASIVNDELLRRELLRVDRVFADALERASSGRDIAEELLGEHAARVAPMMLESVGMLPGLERARVTYALSPFEREALFLALLPEIDHRYAEILERLQGTGRRRITVGLASRLLAYLADDTVTALRALGTDGHLYRTGLIDLLGEGPFSDRALAIPQDFWPRLVGATSPPLFPTAAATETALGKLVLHSDTRRAADAVVALKERRSPRECLIVVHGAEGSGREALARAIASELGYNSMIVDATADPRFVAREAAWNLAAVIVRGDSSADTLSRVAAEISTPLIVVAGDTALVRELEGKAQRVVAGVEVGPLDQTGRARLWERLLANTLSASEVDAQVLAARFRFGPGRIQEIVSAARTTSQLRGDRVIQMADVSAAMRVGTTTAGALARRLECTYRPDDIVLPPTTRRELNLVMAWARHSATAFLPDTAGGRISARGGLVCLFSGPPGTGKTMAAQVIAASLHLSLVRIDLSQVVSKYIGETEKNLERVFADAEATGTVLFFDEADALFGKRSQVSDAHDRYANLETAYLLQRLESHPGIVILATNLHANLDAAFLRRFQVVAEFPLPGPAERTQIWERHLATEHLATDVDMTALGGMFALSGGEIRNAAITAVLLAAADETRVAMSHLCVAMWRELRKSGRMLSPDDFGPWRDVIVAYGRSG